jgi:phosphonate transport system substrate-binding protein
MRLTRLAPVLATGLAALAVTACGSSKDDASSSSKSTDNAATSTNVNASARVTCPDGGVKFGIEPYEAPAKLTPAYNVLAKAMSTKLGCPVKLQIVADYSAEVLAMRNGKLDVAEFGPLGFVFASQKAGAEPIASFGVAGGKLSSYTAGIWVPKDSKITELSQLKGKSLALSEPGSTSGDAMPRYAIRQAGLKDSDVKIDYAGGHPEALLALKNGKVDAGEINTQELASAKAEGAFDETKFRKIWTSEDIPNDPVTVRSDMDPALKAAISDALLHLQPADVSKVGAFLDVDPPGPMVAVTKDTYKPLFDLAQTLGLTEKDV